MARSEVGGLARATLANFGLVLLVALILVIPQDARATGLELQATATIVLLVISLRNTWDLLVSVGEATMEHESKQH